MLEFVFTMSLLVGFGMIIYLLAAALPRVAEETEEAKAGFFDRLAHSEIPEKIDGFLNRFLIKLLQRFKVSILKIDNIIHRYLNRLRQQQNGNHKTLPVEEMTSENRPVDRDNPGI